MGQHKQPYRFVLKAVEPFAMAGIGARGDTRERQITFAIFRTEANDLMRPVHERMRVMLINSYLTIVISLTLKIRYWPPIKSPRVIIKKDWVGHRARPHWIANEGYA
jgi:SOS response associated peptidase (SRAP)